MKLIIKIFEDVGLKVILDNKLINIELQDAELLLKEFNLKPNDSIKVKTNYIKDSDINVLVFSTNTSDDVIFNGINFIIDWFDNKSLLYRNWEKSRTSIREYNQVIAQFRPTLILDTIRKKLIVDKVIKCGIIEPLIGTRKEMTLDNKFRVVYIYLNHSEQILVSHFKRKYTLTVFLTGENLPEVYEEIKRFILLRTKLRLILISKLKLDFFKNIKLKRNNK